MKQIISTEAVAYDGGCFDCNNQSCWMCGHDIFPMPYCEKQPVIDRYEKGVAHDFGKKCKTCLHRLTPVNNAGPCGRCTHAN